MIEKKLDSIIKRYRELEEELSSESTAANPEKYKVLSQEHSSLTSIVIKIKAYQNCIKELNGLKDLKESDDGEMRKMAELEFESLREKKEKAEAELKVMLLPADPNANKNVIMEIRAGTGGDEAALFVGELFRMYCRYSESKGWKIEIMDSHSTGLGGFKEVVFMVSGRGVWKSFKYESGIHRVQRVPLTEASGRIHTSAVSIAVLPEAEEVDVEIRTDDLRIDTYRASGKGGQHVNKTDSAVRITHIPSGIVVACQDERSQNKNKMKSMKILRSKLLEKTQRDQQQKIEANRKQQIGSGDRSEKIRTYNYPQSRITDHRINFSMHNLKTFMEGEIEEMVTALINEEARRKLEVTD